MQAIEEGADLDILVPQLNALGAQARTLEAELAIATLPTYWNSTPQRPSGTDKKSSKSNKHWMLAIQLALRRSD